MNYKEHFSGRISQYLVQLKKELDEDIPRLGELVPEVTLGEADTYLERVAGMVDSYHSLFHRQSKSSTKANGGTSYYQRQKVIRGYDAKIEAALPGIFEKEGYVTAAIIQQQTGIEGGEAEKRLKALSKKYKWREGRDRQHPETIRYQAARPARQSQEATPNTPAKGEQG